MYVYIYIYIYSINNIYTSILTNNNTIYQTFSPRQDHEHHPAAADPADPLPGAAIYIYIYI